MTQIGVRHTVGVIGSVEDQPRTRLGRLGDWYDRHRGARSIVIGWLVTRALSLLLLLAAERYSTGDVSYYRRKLAALFDVGLDQTLNEYPTPVVWILLLPYGAGGGTRVGYLVAFMVFMLVLDAAFTYAVYRSAGRRHDRAVDFWVLFVPLVGSLDLRAVRPAAGGPGRRRAARRPAPAVGHRGADRAGRGGEALARPTHPDLPRPQARPPPGRASPSWSSASAWPRSACWPAA